MSVPFKPHQFRVFAVSARLGANNVVEGFAPDTPGIYISGCAQQMSPNAAYDIFARDVTNGFAFYVDVTDLNRSTFEVGGTIEWVGDLYAIEKVQTNEQGLATDHIAVYAVGVKH